MRTIYADKLINEIVFHTNFPTDIKEEIEDIIQNAPPAIEPERPKGKWIRNDNGTWSCDQCYSWIPDEQHYYANWCLYCGADMRGEKDEGD